MTESSTRQAQPQGQATPWQATLANARQCLIALDQLANTLAGLALALLALARLRRPPCVWWADETISAHCWRWHCDGTRHWPWRVVDALALLFRDKDHCRQSYESERLGRQLPPEYRPDHQPSE